MNLNEARQIRDKSESFRSAPTYNWLLLNAKLEQDIEELVAILNKLKKLVDDDQYILLGDELHAQQVGSDETNLQSERESLLVGDIIRNVTNLLYSVVYDIDCKLNRLHKQGDTPCNR